MTATTRAANGPRLATSTGPALARTGGIAVAKGGGRQTEAESRCALSRFKATVSRRPVNRDGSAPENASASSDVAALGPPGAT